MVAEDLRDRPVPGEADEPGDTGLERRDIGDVEPTWIECVPGEQDRSPAIVEGDAQLAVAGQRDRIEDPAAEIDLSDVIGPARNAKPALGGLELDGSDLDRDLGDP